MKNVFLLHGMSCKLDDCFGLKLKEELRNMGFNIFEPFFSLAPNITLANWTEEMDKFKKHIKETDIFICHSLSTNFILKYFAQNKLKCKALIAVAGGYLTENSKVQKGYEYLVELVPSYEEIKYCKNNILYKYNVFCYQDHIWLKEELDNYTEKLGATRIELNYGGHFGRSSKVKEIPEILDIIKSFKL